MEKKLVGLVVGSLQGKASAAAFALLAFVCIVAFFFFKKLDFDFGMPDPHSMDSTFFNT